jgi:hypothetical protein
MKRLHVKKSLIKAEKQNPQSQAFRAIPSVYTVAVKQPPMIKAVVQLAAEGLNTALGCGVD